MKKLKFLNSFHIPVPEDVLILPRPLPYRPEVSFLVDPLHLAEEVLYVCPLNTSLLTGAVLTGNSSHCNKAPLDRALLTVPLPCPDRALS